MTIFPDFTRGKEIAASGRYDVLPVSCKLHSDFCTPIEVLRILKNASTHCYLLESAQQNEKWGRYSFLGFDPKMKITCLDGRLHAGEEQIQTCDPSGYLCQLLSRYRSPRLENLPPFTGGLAGYFSYDYLAYSEPTAKTQV